MAPQSPEYPASLDALLLGISRQLHERGWALMCTPHEGNLFQFTVGLRSLFDHPDLELLGLPQEQGQHLLEELVARIGRGLRLHPGDFFSDLLPGRDLFLVHNPIDLDGPAVLGDRLRVMWPDERQRYPWHADCSHACGRQAALVDTDGFDEAGLRLLFSRGGMAD